MIGISSILFAFMPQAIANTTKCCLDVSGKQTDVIATSGCLNGTGPCISKGDIQKKTKQTGKGIEKGLDKAYDIK